MVVKQGIQSVAQRTGRSSVQIAKIYGQKPDCTEASSVAYGYRGPSSTLSGGQTGPSQVCSRDCLWEVVAQLERVKERKMHN